MVKRWDAVIRRLSRAVKADEDGQYASVTAPRELPPTSSMPSTHTHTHTIKSHELRKSSCDSVFNVQSTKPPLILVVLESCVYSELQLLVSKNKTTGKSDQR